MNSYQQETAALAAFRGFEQQAPPQESMMNVSHPMMQPQFPAEYFEPPAINAPENYFFLQSQMSPNMNGCLGNTQSVQNSSRNDDADSVLHTLVAQQDDRKRVSKRSKKRKDPNEPQKPPSAYARFFRDTQLAIKRENPDASFGEVSKIVASMWESLDPEQKEDYKRQTEVEKKEYLKQLAAYQAQQVSKVSSSKHAPIQSANVPPSQYSPDRQQQQQQTAPPPSQASAQQQQHPPQPPFYHQATATSNQTPYAVNQYPTGFSSSPMYQSPVFIPQQQQQQQQLSNQQYVASESGRLAQQQQQQQQQQQPTYYHHESMLYAMHGGPVPGAGVPGGAENGHSVNGEPMVPVHQQLPYSRAGVMWQMDANHSTHNVSPLPPVAAVSSTHQEPQAKKEKMNFHQEGASYYPEKVDKTARNGCDNYLDNAYWNDAYCNAAPCVANNCQ